MARKRGEPLQKIGKSLCRPHTTICNWILLCAAGGLDRLHDAKRQGPARRLAEGQLAELKEDLMAGPQEHDFESGMWTGKMVVRHVLNRYGVQYVLRAMQELRHEMGFRHIKPRPRHPKATSDEAREAFKKASRLATYYHNSGYRILAGDEAAHILGPPQYRAVTCSASGAKETRRQRRP